MTKCDKFSFYTIYKILLSISIFVAGGCLIWGCLSIYCSGNGYSRQIVAETFSKICVPVYICLTFIVGSFVINFFTKGTNKKHKFFKIENFKQNEPPKINSKTLLIVKITVIIISVCVLVFGAFCGGFADVLTKAVNICTECIGLG